MKKAVYIGGFAGGRSSVEAVGDTIAETLQLDDIEKFTFSDAMNEWEKLRARAMNEKVITHSAGAMAVADCGMASLIGFSPPVPTSRTRLLAMTTPKTINMLRPSKTGKRIPASTVMEYNAGAVAELAAHPVANFRPLINGAISKFDSVKMGLDAVKSGIDVQYIFTDNDEYFQLSEAQKLRARLGGVAIQHINGVHDQLYLSPQSVLEEVFSR